MASVCRHFNQRRLMVAHVPRRIFWVGIFVLAAYMWCTMILLGDVHAESYDSTEILQECAGVQPMWLWQYGCIPILISHRSTQYIADMSDALMRYAGVDPPIPPMTFASLVRRTTLSIFAIVSATSAVTAAYGSTSPLSWTFEAQTDVSDKHVA